MAVVLVLVVVNDDNDVVPVVTVSWLTRGCNMA